MASKKRQDDVLSIIHDRLVPDEEAKKARGEVFTPLPLVREMLFGLRKSSLLAGKQEVWGVDENGECIEDNPDDRVGGIPLEVWRDPTTKWLDPANGIGNFPVVTFYMLDYQLGKHGPPQYRGDEHKQARRKHIVEKMLYMIEFNKGNVNTSRKIFKLLVPTAESNICCADSLNITNKKLEDVFGIFKFDVVMGNPPFNPGTIWWKFIERYNKLATKYMLFIVPSTFTSNTTGEKIVEHLKSNGLKIVKYLESSDFQGQVDLDILYFVLENGYHGNITVNNAIHIKRTSPLINLKTQHDSNIFLKLLKYVEAHGHVQLFKGKNHTLGYKNPVETDNIKFKQSEKYKHRMLSRLGGGDHQYFWVDHFIGDEIDSPKIVFPRGTGLYSSKNNMLNVSKDMVYSTCVSKDEILSDSIMYTPLESIGHCDSLKWYLMRSKLVRYIFMKVNHLAELTPTIFKYIPIFDTSKIKNDNDVYTELELNEDEIKYLENIFSKKTDEHRSSVSRKAKKSNAAKEPGPAMGGAGGPSAHSVGPTSSASSNHRYARRTRRNRRGRREGV
jgi:hypothetical protein